MESAIDDGEQEPLPARLPKGYEIGGCVVDGWLRDGGMAAIYRGRRKLDERRVAIKLQLPSTAGDPEMCARFDREAEVMARANGSPHVVELYDAGRLADGRRYFALEWVEGENLEELLDHLRNQDQRMSIVRACRIGRDVAQGLAELHEHGVLHLDLKPANVMVVTREDGGDDVKLVDFGIAADLHESGAGASGDGGEAGAGEAVLGTWGYMAPEQVEGKAANASFDVYALGVLLFEAITGNAVPPRGWTAETLPRVERLRRGVPQVLAELVRGCMEFEPGRRPESAERVAAELGRIVRGLDAERSGGRGKRGSSNEVMARSGGTEVVRYPGPARTGGTELMTYDEVLSRSGMSSSLSLEVQEAARRGLERRKEIEREKARARGWGWVIAGAMVAVVAVGAVWVGVGGGEPEVEGLREKEVEVPAKVQAEIEVGERGVERSGERVEVLSTRVGDDGARMEVRDDADAAAAADEGETGLVADEPRSEALPSEPPIPASVSEAEPEQAPSDPVSPRTSVNTPPRRLTEESCQTLRTEAVVARQMRTWRRVLKLTGTRSCWLNGEQKLERRRLRVEAYAELGEFGKCVREGEGAGDAQIEQRVKFCRKSLGG